MCLIRISCGMLKSKFKNGIFPGVADPDLEGSETLVGSESGSGTEINL
jgi:hypothetical protein